jgi:hypothetical protein
MTSGQSEQKLPQSSFVLKVDSISTILGIACLAAWSFFPLLRALPDAQGTDFYPLWIGLQTVIAGGNPYSPSTAELLRNTWQVHKIAQVADVVGYPLPVLLILAPLSLLTLQQAVAAWCLLLVAAIGIFSIAFGNKKISVFVMPLLFFPAFHAVVIKTSTVLWLGLIGCLVIAIRNNRSVMAGFCIALLPGKPQAGLIFALGAVIWAIREQHYKILASAGCWIVLLWGGSLLVQPNWPIDWWRTVAEYQDQVMLVSLMPEGLLVPLFSLGLSWLAFAAAIQTVAFPVNDIYCSLPLLVGWMEMRPLIALLGIGASWSVVLLYPNPNHPLVLWTIILLPYCVGALINRLVNLSRENASGSPEQ